MGTNATASATQAMDGNQFGAVVLAGALIQVKTEASPAWASVWLVGPATMAAYRH